MRKSCEYRKKKTNLHRVHVLNHLVVVLVLEEQAILSFVDSARGT